MIKITKITIEYNINNDADILEDSLGTYTNNPESYSLIRKTGRLFRDVERAEKIISDLNDIIYDECEKDSYIAICEKRRDNIQSFIDENTPYNSPEYGYFTPAFVVDCHYDYEKVYNRLCSFENGNWWYIGICLVAYSHCEHCNEENEVCRESLWGIESDSGDHYFKEIEHDLYRELIKNFTQYVSFEDCIRIDC